MHTMADTPERDQAPTDPAGTASPAEGTEGTAGAEHVGAEHADELKDRFRAALERKRGEAKARSAQGHGAGSQKVGESHRKAGGKRTFRRKSG
jgi:hypothetical protein